MALPWGSKEGERPVGATCPTLRVQHGDKQPYQFLREERRPGPKNEGRETERPCWECPGLDMVTHWSSGADRRRTPGWRLRAESRPQERHSPVWHSPGQRGQGVRPGPSLGSPEPHWAAPGQGLHREQPWPHVFQTAKRVGSSTISLTSLVRLSQTLATSRCKHPAGWAWDPTLGTFRTLSLRQRLVSPGGL